MIGGRYDLRERIGEGGLAEAYLALDQLTDEEVVLKIARPGRDPELLMREHAVLRSVSHRALVRARGGVTSRAARRIAAGRVAAWR